MYIVLSASHSVYCTIRMPSCTLCYPLATGILYYPQVIVHIALPDGHGAYDTIREHYRPVTDTLHYPLATGILHCPTVTDTLHYSLATGISHCPTATVYTALSASHILHYLQATPYTAPSESHAVYYIFRKPQCILSCPQTTVYTALSANHNVSHYTAVSEIYSVNCAVSANSTGIPK